MITRSLIELVFSAASIERWNDHPHPPPLPELGKQAHKMIMAWVIARYEGEARGRKQTGRLSSREASSNFSTE